MSTDSNPKFKSGDKVVEIGTKTPLMEIRGNTKRGGNPYKTLTDTYTCYWETHEPNWKEFEESELELVSDTK